jgi:ribosomal protein S18 acetylase RimI-like enzyme
MANAYRSYIAADGRLLEEAEKKNKSFADTVLLDGFFTVYPQAIEIIRSDSRLSIFTEAGEILGILEFRKMTFKKHIHIDFIYIRHDRRSQGIGKQAIEYLKGLGFHKITADAFSNKAEKFFYDNGFKGKAGGRLTLKA